MGGIGTPRTYNEKYRKDKREKILESARLVFCRKGFHNVTMQDIIDACEISRGGIYLYFSSVDEIFREVVKRRNKEKFNILRKSMDEGQPFNRVLDAYLALQKERLLQMENSLFRAVCEYNFSSVGDGAQDFCDTQISELRRSVLSILTLGVRQNAIRDEGIPELADHFIVVIDGLSVFALAKVLTEQIVTDQFTLLARLVDNIRM